MKYYYNYDLTQGGCTENCPKDMWYDMKCIKIGSWVCAECIYLLEYSEEQNYIECKVINNTERLKKLNSL